MARTMQQWLDDYGVSHQHPFNKAIHWFDVPGIVLTVIAMIWVIPTPAAFEQIPFLNWATITMVIAGIWYLRLSIVMGIAMVLYFAACGYLVHIYEAAGYNVLMTAIIAFVILWVFQFIGHKIEGKKPSFAEDVQFLMIGPAWVWSFIFNKLGIKY